MGTRNSDAFNIKKADIGKSVFLKHYKEFSEWWVYRTKESRFVDLFGKQLKKGEQYLYCIIICNNEGDGIRQQNEGLIAIEGIKFDNGETKDLDDYLRKTERSL